MTTDSPATFAPAGLGRAIELLTGRSIAVLTGAGVSTDSGIPDYRGAGAPVRTPMTFEKFLSGEDSRRRYWAGSHLGWKRFDGAKPNAGHFALARLERDGVTNGVITQNVDGLHLRAGSQHVVDLHGTMHRVRCLNCGQTFARDDIAHRISEANPWIDLEEARELGPDGDVVFTHLDDFVVPECTVCGGILKPEVVFFGEFVPKEKFYEALSLVEAADALLIAGSSLAVNSGIRLLDRAVKRHIPVVIVNRGATKGDSRADITIDAGTSEVLTTLAERLDR